MTTLEVLKAAREKIADPAHWIQGWYALDANGQRLSVEEVESGTGVCFCAVGALLVVDGANGFTHPFHSLKSALRNEFGDASITGVFAFNDTHTHPEVLALFDKAIAAEEAKAGSND